MLLWCADRLGDQVTINQCLAGTCYYNYTVTGGEVLHHELGNKIVNVRGMVPQCIGNESHIDDCDNITANECNPVLVDCGLASDGDSNSSGGIWMIIVAVAPPLLLIVLIAVCAIVIRVWRKGTFYR